MDRPMFRAAPVHVRVPATSANLGPGFDAFGLALSLFDDVVARATDDGLHIDVAGEGADDVPRNEKHLLVKSMRVGFDAMGGQPRGLEVVCANRIPHSRGLGSSAAAIVGGLVAARALVLGGEELLDDAALLALATEIEGHPDNVAACLLGGLTLAWTDADGGHATRAVPVDALRPVIFVPATKSSTAKARALMPAVVPHADAAFNAGRAGLLVHALCADPSALFPATEDRLHQSYRAPAMARSATLVQKLRADGIAAVISGAGGTVLAMGTTADPVTDPDAYAGKSFAVIRLGVDLAGAAVIPRR
jgi:homoserine kinase